jgi:hypothetical protein|tara:strand:+ start:521 stop:688 length:168 start_codon:yes stop_codon:yes gene_type:complete
VVEAMVALLQDPLCVELFQMEKMELLIPVVVAEEVLLQVEMMLEQVAQEFYLQKN